MTKKKFSTIIFFQYLYKTTFQEEERIEDIANAVRFCMPQKLLR